jgi:hypothetical protein
MSLVAPAPVVTHRGFSIGTPTMNSHIAAPAALIAFVIGIWLWHMGGTPPTAIGVAVCVFCLGVFIRYVDARDT